MDTIFAVSSGAPPAAIAVLRISGAEALRVAAELAGPLAPFRQATLRTLRNRAGDALDRALVLAFEGPATATGEDLVELHLHGGRATIDAVEAALLARGLRRAEAGEFTRRALGNGRIDLAEAEGLGDLLAAETETQRRAALSNTDGAVSRRIRTWSQQAIALAAQIEAQIDFSDEDDVGPEHADRLRDGLLALSNDIREVLEAPPVERLRDGIRVVLAGPPNAGKSALLNALAGREAAIVTPQAGTTRDVIEVPVSRNGLAYVLTDVAGMRDDVDDVVEEIGIARAKQAAAAADIVIWLGDTSAPFAGALSIWPRADIPSRRKGSCSGLFVSSITGEGLVELWSAIEARALELVPRSDQLALNRRQRGLVQVAQERLKEGSLLADPILQAECIRAALRTFDQVVGRIGVEQVLDDIFAKFCIGK